MKVRDNVEDMAVELQGAAMILDELRCNRSKEDWLDTCDVIATIQGAIRRIGTELHMVANNNDVWKEEKGRNEQ